MPEFAHPAWLWALLAVPLCVMLRARAEATLSPPRRLLAGTLRGVGAGALVLALSGPLTGTTSPHTDVVFALDVSRSIDADAAARARRLINDAIAAGDPDQRLGVVVFGADAAVESTLRSGLPPLEEPSATVDRNGSNVQRGLELAMSRFASGGARRVVLLSDGFETAGSARAAATAAAAAGVELVTVTLPGGAADRAAVDDVQAPATVAAGEPFSLRVHVRARAAGPAELTLLRNGRIVHRTRLALLPGSSDVVFTDDVAQAGLYEYETVLNAPGDPVPENNRFAVFVSVRGPPRVALATSAAPQTSALLAALSAQNIVVDTFAPAALPGSLHRLSDYSLVILDNVSAFELSLAKLRLLEEYVRDAGGGVWVVGGERTFSAGGYQSTPLESLLPVTMDIPTEVKIPSLVVAVLIDRSGSMSGTAQGQEKLAIAKNAAFAAIEVLNPLDRIGVLAFDNATEWIVPPTEAGHRGEIAARLRALSAGGGTNLLAALEEAYRVMRSQSAKIKHLIVLSDGLSDTEGDTGDAFDAVTARLADARITVSTVAFGHDANQPFMARLAALGQGRFYFTDDPRNVPRIFTSETVVISRGLIVERDTQPQRVHASEILDGLDTLPPLAGYMRVFAKPAATLLLAGADDDPLLAAWRYGLGRSVAFMSDMQGRWSRDWLAWPAFGRFAAQTARWTMRRESGFGMHPTFTFRDGRGALDVDIRSADDQHVNGLAVSATVNGPRGSTLHPDVTQVAPGRYRADFDAPGTGRYYVSLSARTPSAQGTDVGGAAVTLPPQTFGAALSYTREFRVAAADPALLDALAEATGGEHVALDAASVPRLLAETPGSSRHLETLWWPFALLALLVLVAEVAARRVQLPARWRRRARSAPAPDSPAPDYAALVADIERAREAHLGALHNRFDYPLDEPAGRARLYLATQRRTARS